MLHSKQQIKQTPVVLGSVGCQETSVANRRVGNEAHHQGIPRAFEHWGELSAAEATRN